ncbi:GNAT family N-acetyltransferase [Streptomyces sp. NRRL F-2664]|uniref:GNAT family N-acetyltransferase n=1 Tax=Streptomyces sp. NRRL F-2664 TaxID=1463842 RepID=UPI0004C52B9D|nr:GNAT family N-acetyltransferase [Streptomyces sp. NRRL F-2664]
MTELQRLRAEHAPALLAFERANRAYFAESVPDRGDAYFAEFDARLAELLAGQEAGRDHLHLIIGGDGEVLGRVNLIDVEDGSAELGFRVAKEAAGRGLATNAVRQALVLAADTYGLRLLRAAATVDNTGSRTVLQRTGFLPVGETVLDGRPAIRYVRDLGAARQRPAGA